MPFRKVISVTCLLFTSTGLLALQPEDVLGEYWKDPLFGEAAAQHSVRLEVLTGKLFPEHLAVTADATFQLIVENRTGQAHMLAISRDVTQLMRNEKFLRFRDDVMLHEEKARTAIASDHSHSGSSVDDAQSLVKTLDQQPTIYLRPNEKKEILLRFSVPELLTVFCVLPGHGEEGHQIAMRVDEK